MLVPPELIFVIIPSSFYSLRMTNIGLHTGFTKYHVNTKSAIFSVHSVKIGMIFETTKTIGGYFLKFFRNFSGVPLLC